MRKPKYPEITLIDIWHKEPQLFQLMSIEDWNAELKAQMDMLYFYSHSGDKLAAPFVHHFLATDDDELSAEAVASIAENLMGIFSNQWARLWAAYNLEYNPLNNFSSTEQVDETHQDDDTETHTKGTSDTRTLNTTDTRQADRDVDEQSDRSAYNASTYQPVDKVHTDDIINNDTLRKTGTDTMAHTGEDLDDKYNEGEYHITKTRSGNSGAYPYQDIIRKERELWRTNYFEQVFRDVDSILTLPIYPADEHWGAYWRFGYPNI